MDISVARHAERAADRALSIAAKAWAWISRRDLKWAPDMKLVDPTRRSIDETIWLVSGCRIAMQSLASKPPEALPRPQPREPRRIGSELGHVTIHENLNPHPRAGDVAP